MKKFFLAFLLVSFFALTAIADTICLKNSKSVSSDIIERTDGIETIQQDLLLLSTLDRKLFGC